MPLHIHLITSVDPEAAALETIHLAIYYVPGPGLSTASPPSPPCKTLQQPVR